MRLPARRSRLQPWLKAGILLATVLSAADCAGKAPPSQAGGPENVELQVVNRHWLDITIYVVRGGQLTRVGVATSSSETGMVLPSRLLSSDSELRLYGEPIGSLERAITEVLVVQPGQYIEWQLEAELSRSTVGVY